MDVTGVRKAIDAVREAVKKLTFETIEAGKKNPREFNGIQPLSKIDVLCDKAVERLEQAVKASAPKPPKEEKPDGKKKADKK